MDLRDSAAFTSITRPAVRRTHLGHEIGELNPALPSYHAIRACVCVSHKSPVINSMADRPQAMVRTEFQKVQRGR